MDGTTLQTLIVALIIAAAGIFLARRGLRLIASARRKEDSGGCGGGCGCK